MSNARSQLKFECVRVLAMATLLLATGCAMPSLRQTTASRTASNGRIQTQTTAKVETAAPLSGGVTIPSTRSDANAVIARAQSPMGEVWMPFQVAPTAWVSNGTVQPVAGSQPIPVQVAQNLDAFGQPVPYGAPLPYGAPIPYNAPGGYLPDLPRWNPYVAGLGKFGNKRTSAIGDIVVPLAQDGQSMLFADLRGRYDDSNNTEGNFGLGYRSIVDPFWILGGYGFFDMIHTNQGGKFQQVAFGLEALSIPFEARVNGYVPLKESQQIAGPVNAQAVGNGIFLVGNEQRAYYGADAEVGALLWHSYDMQKELRGFIGGYYFDTNKAGFPTIAGPRGRLELRSYDLPCLGPESRLTFGVEAQWDDVNDFQVSGLARVVIPLGVDRSRRLSPLERRMLDRIVRDDDVVTHTAQTPRELALDAATGRLLDNVRVIDANTADPAGVIAAANPLNGTIVADGTAGVINTTGTLFLQSGQVLYGGGFNVIGQNTGTVANFGSRPTINVNSLDPQVDGVSIASNTAVRGLDVTGGLGGGITNNDGASNFPDLSNISLTDINVTGSAQGGFVLGTIDAASVISGNTATATGGDGFTFLGDVAGTVSGNTASLNVGSGFGIYGNLVAFGDLTGTLSNNIATANDGFGLLVANTVSGNIDDNVVTGNGLVGITAGNVTGTINRNVVTNNGFTGISVTNDTSGTIDENTSSNNSSGIVVGNNLTGSISNNTTNDNAGFGISVGNATGNIRNNTTANNGFSGINVGGTASGTIANNVATGNFFGIGVNNLSATGQVTGNQLTANTRDGLAIINDAQGTISNNVAMNNAFAGLSVGNDLSGTVDSNIATGNGTFGVVVVNALTGTVSNNTATGNSLDGFMLGQNGTISGQVTGNTASGNARNGFTFGNTVSGVVSNNTATANAGTNPDTFTDEQTGNGFLFQGNVSGTVTGNSATGNRDDGFEFAQAMSGLVANNNASGNGFLNGSSFFGGNGYHFLGTMTGTINGNQSTSNQGDGFNLLQNSSGTISSNLAQGNGFNGFTLQRLTGGTVSTNIATGNTSDGFEIGSDFDNTVAGVWSGGNVIFNNSTGNTLFGYRVNNRTAFPATFTLGNTASGNGNDTLPVAP